MRKVIHFTTVHPRTDTRIRVKEVATLARALDVPVELYVQDGLGDEWVEDPGFWIRDTGSRPSGRIARMTLGAWRMFRAVRRARPEVAHFHDPELLPWAILLRWLGVKVIYDVHEDLPQQLLHKSYLSKPLAQLLGKMAALMERASSMFVDGFVPVVPSMLKNFPANKTVMVANFPMLSEFGTRESLNAKATAVGRFVYTGSITVARGIANMVDSMAELDRKDARLVLMGGFENEALKRETSERDGWQFVEPKGWVSREVVASELSMAQAGVVLLLPRPQYLIAYPVKMFEYMAAGLPVIASDFPVLREIIDEAQCGMLVDPENPKQIAEAMQWIIKHPEEAEEMGRRGREAVERKYNWDHEAAKLISFYGSELSVPLKNPDALPVSNQTRAASRDRAHSTLEQDRLRRSYP